MFLKAFRVTTFTMTSIHYGLYKVSCSFFMSLLTVKCKEWLYDSSRLLKTSQSRPVRHISLDNRLHPVSMYICCYSLHGEAEYELLL